MNERRLIVVLLTVIAVVLTLNLMQGPRTAVAQQAQEVGGDGEPYVAAVDVEGFGNTERLIYRIWSDGQVDVTTLSNWGGCVAEGPQVIVPPADHEFPVIDAGVHVREPGAGAWVVQLFEDGRVDLGISGQDQRCTVFGSGGAFCLGDVDRDGEADFADLLIVLGAWGPCP